ncbi:M48 family metallopeptidase [Myxococcus stipitatus]|uniref:M48 family metallopeptidase n=1 Tax=Myxococcus stipitatus TaxID=83455 RepID=UPI001F2AE20F|nr:M48 family metallopeptidase [Myxococcus stipitatus]MCE9669129.1 M48 family metallopeptidase [Myxococcus stipitatus]
MTRRGVFVGLGLAALTVACQGLDASTLAGTGVKVLGSTAQASQRAKQTCGKLNVDPTVAEEYALGSAMAIEWVKEGGGLMLAARAEGGQGSPVHAGVHTYVNLVGKNLAAQSKRPTLEWTFGVIDDAKSVNALSAPGGYIFVTRALLAELENEGQLAGTLAHEIAHVVLKHSIQQYNKAKVDLCETAIYSDALVPGSGRLIAATKGDGTLDLDGDPALLDSAAQKTLGFFSKGNDQKMEFAADEMAVQLMVSAGYDPEDYRRLLAKTEEVTTVGSRHPKKAERVKRLVAYLATLKGAKDGEFSELSLEGLRSPPLEPTFVAAVRGVSSGVAKDGK